MPILLVITVLLPLAGALALGLQPRLEHRQARTIALGVALATLALTAVLLVSFQSGLATPQFAFTETGSDGQTRYGLSWVRSPDIRFALGLDGLSIGLFGLTSLLLITAICSSWEPITERAGLHYALLLALEGG